MSHYAKVVSGIVTQVIVADQVWVDSLDGTWVQTSYNTQGGVHLLGDTALRKNYAGIGYTYDSTRDAFYAPQPFPSWTLNEETCLWEAPVPYPDEGMHTWDEDTTSWVEMGSDE
jgi:hypothetical protein